MQELFAELDGLLADKPTVLVKASRGMAFETIITKIITTTG